MKPAPLAAAIGLACLSLTGHASALVIINTDSQIGEQATHSALNTGRISAPPPLPAASAGTSNQLPGTATTQAVPEVVVSQDTPSPAHEQNDPGMTGGNATERNIAAVGTTLSSTEGPRGIVPSTALPVVNAASNEMTPPPRLSARVGDRSRQPLQADNKRAWEVKVGRLADQITAWGEQDPTWNVVWDTGLDVYVDVPHRIYAPLDEAIIEVVTAFAKQGVALRIVRARENRQIFIKGN